MRHAAVCAVTLAIIFFMWSSSPYGKEDIQVELICAEVSDIQRTVTLKGRAEELGRHSIYPEQTSKIDEIYVSVGDTVKAGQPLLKLSPAAYYEDDTEDSESAGAFDISAILAESGADILSSITGDDINAIISAFMPSESKTGSFGDLSDASEVFSGIAESPIDGTVMELPYNVGDIVTQSQACVCVSDLKRMAVSVSVPESILPLIETGMKAEVTGEGFAGVMYKGVVEKIMPFAKEASLFSESGSGVESRIRVLNADGRLLPGLTASVKIYVDYHEQSLRLPYEAVYQDDANREYVWLVEDGRALKRYVSTGFELEDDIEITAGLDAGDKVIINAPESLCSGSAVAAAGY